jgi:hypothetical protein
MKSAAVAASDTTFLCGLSQSFYSVKLLRGADGVGQR